MNLGETIFSILITTSYWKIMKNWKQKTLTMLHLLFDLYSIALRIALKHRLFGVVGGLLERKKKLAAVIRLNTMPFQQKRLDLDANRWNQGLGRDGGKGAKIALK